MLDPQQSSPPLRSIASYELRREIASGGMGTVYEAIQQEPRRVVALKVMRSGLSGEVAVARFKREAELLARLHHPNIAQVYEAGTERAGDMEIPWFAMEYIEGGRAITEYARGLALGERLRLLLQAADAVQHGHERSVIHRDIKPSNLLVDATGFVKLIDFGVARAADADALKQTQHTVADQLMGTLQYMSPEQCLGDARAVDVRSDVYSLGVVAYEVITGQAPYDLRGKNIVAAAATIRTAAPELPTAIDPTLPEAINDVLLRSLAKLPWQRQAEVGDFAAELRAAALGEPVPQTGTVSNSILGPTRSGRPQIRRMLLIAAVVTILATAAGWLMTLPVIFNNTPGAWCERTLTQYPPAFMTESMPQTVAIVQLTEKTDIDALATSLGLKGVDSNPSNRKSLRRLHASLLDHLALADVRAVVFDLWFEDATEFDSDLGRSAEALVRRGVPVLAIAARSRHGGVTETLRPHLRLGSALSGIAKGSALITDYVAIELPGEPPLPSLGVATSMALYEPDSRMLLHLGDENLTLQFGGRGDDGPAGSKGYGEVRSRTIRPSRIVSAAQSDAQTGIRAGTRMAVVHSPVPTDAVLRRCVIEYQDAFVLPLAELRARLDGRVVVVGNLLPGGEPLRQIGVSRWVSGTYLIAALIHAALVGGWVTFAPQWAILASCAACSAAACTIAIIFRHRMSGFAVGLILLVSAIAALCAVSYMRLGLWLNPGPPVFSALLGGSCMYAALREKRLSGGRPWERTTVMTARLYIFVVMCAAIAISATGCSAPPAGGNDVQLLANTTTTFKLFKQKFKDYDATPPTFDYTIVLGLTPESSASSNVRWMAPWFVDITGAKGQIEVENIIIGHAGTTAIVWMSDDLNACVYHYAHKTGQSVTVKYPNPDAGTITKTLSGTAYIELARTGVDQPWSAQTSGPVAFTEDLGDLDDPKFTNIDSTRAQRLIDAHLAARSIGVNPQWP